jgi:hypothetical protein
MKKDSSPMILHVSWGLMEVAGHGTFRDARIYPGCAMEWDWKESSTHHSPGIQPADVEEFLGKGITKVFLGIGMWGRLKVCPETVELLENAGIKVSIMHTPEAVAFYNEARDYEQVAGLFHTTC